MERVMDGRRLGRAALREGPPHWAVVIVKCCVIGILLLPLSTVLWVVASSVWPEATADLGPLAFTITLCLGVTLFAAASVLTSTYPPVRSAKPVSAGDEERR